MAVDHEPAPPRRHRPRSATVFIAAFVAGAAAAVGINRALDVHLAQAKPQVECEPIFVALRSLPQGVPVTVWDVALRDWPKAMMPSAAVRVNDSFEGWLLKHPLREGQPLLTVQLLRPAAPALDEPTLDEVLPEEEVFVPPVPATTAAPVEPAPVAAQTAVPLKETIPTAIPVTTEPPPELLVTAEPQPEPVITADIVADIAAETTAEITADIAAESPAEIAAEQAPVAEPVSQPAIETSVATVTEPPAPEQAPVEQFVATLPDPATAPAAPEAAILVREPPQRPSLAAIRQEPTPAAPLEAAPPIAAPTPVAIGPQMLGQSADAPFPIDLPSRPVTDVASLPSVMAQGDAATATESSAATESSVRYLVVPERIAQQADTSFTTPTAPGLTGLASEPAPAVASRQPPASQPQAKRQKSGPPQTGTAQASPRGTQRPTTGSRGQATAKQQQQQPRPTDRAATESRTWGGMFPNVSAGLDAINSWRSRGREAVATESPSASPARR